MSFKDFSASHGNSSNDKPENKTKTAPAVDAPATQPTKKKDEGPRAQKS